MLFNIILVFVHSFLYATQRFTIVCFRSLEQPYMVLLSPLILFSILCFSKSLIYLPEAYAIFIPNLCKKLSSPFAFLKCRTKRYLSTVSLWILSLPAISNAFLFSLFNSPTGYLNLLNVSMLYSNSSSMNSSLHIHEWLVKRNRWYSSFCFLVVCRQIVNKIILVGRFYYKLKTSQTLSIRWITVSKNGNVLSVSICIVNSMLLSVNPKEQHHHWNTFMYLKLWDPIALPLDMQGPPGRVSGLP